MAYDNAFFEAYRKYLDEPVVRRNHDRVFREWHARTTPHLLRVVDLGCGTGEFYEHGFYTGYVGIDKEPRINNPHAQVIAEDYNGDGWKKKLAALPFKPNAFVSLFSIEPSMLAGQRYATYEDLFRTLPTLQFGLSAGFYYIDEPDALIVEEEGGLVSHQTLEVLGVYEDDDICPFTEERWMMRTPSKMFGPDVVEVWKFFTRKEATS